MTTGLVGPSMNVTPALGELPLIETGARVRVRVRWPIGHYRVPIYLRGKRGVIEAVIEPRGVDNEEEGFGRNAGSRLHYYRVAFEMTEVWPAYAGPAHDGMRCEIYETWLERV